MKPEPCPRPLRQARQPAAGRRHLLLAALLPVVALSGLVACDSKPQPFNSLDITDADWGKGFRLRDPDGRERSLADFRGKAVMVFFGFTQCPDVCPTALTRAAEVLRLLDDDGSKVQVVFVTVDPERDEPAMLREYTRAFHPSFVGLAGDLQETQAVARDFKVFYQKVPTGSSYTMDHTALSYVFDPRGRLRLAVKHEQTAASVAADLKRLLAERQD